MTPAAKRTRNQPKPSEAEAAATDQDDAAEIEARGAAYRELTSRRFHLEGCPLTDSDDDGLLGRKLELYEQRKPAVVDSNGAVTEPAKLVTVLHCVECGDTYVYNQRMAELLGQEVTT